MVVNIKLNKETLLVVDEFQDLPKYYADAILQIMKFILIVVRAFVSESTVLGYDFWYHFVLF